MKANYHTHTPRCRHAVGAEREYIERAVTGGLEILGFSDHAPFEYGVPGYDSGVRMFPEQLPEYMDTLRSLKTEYAGRIELHAGLEAEYYPDLFPRLREMAWENGVEYLILGQHFLGNEVNMPYCGAATEDTEILRRYVDQSIAGMETGCFTYFAHPDLIHFLGDEAAYEREMRRLCRAAMGCCLPLEFNFLGFREGRNYPDKRFWRIVAEEGNPVVLGCDAHAPEHAWSPDIERRALEYLNPLGIAQLETVPLKAI